MILLTCNTTKTQHERCITISINVSALYIYMRPITSSNREAQTLENGFWLQNKVCMTLIHLCTQSQVHPHTYSPDKIFFTTLFRLERSLNKLSCSICSQIIPCLLCNEHRNCVHPKNEELWETNKPP